jgi:hypothetical protein
MSMNSVSAGAILTASGKIGYFNQISGAIVLKSFTSVFKDVQTNIITPKSIKYVDKFDNILAVVY